MKYWDTSALIPLLIQESSSDVVRPWLQEDAEIATWGLSRLEMAAAIERRARDGKLTAGQRRHLLTHLDTLASHWDEVIDLLAVRRRARAILARWPLRAADAAQLAAALVVSGDDPSLLWFVSLDRSLAQAAEREGFRVLTWPEP